MKLSSMQLSSIPPAANPLAKPLHTTPQRSSHTTAYPLPDPDLVATPLHLVPFPQSSPKTILATTITAIDIVTIQLLSPSLSPVTTPLPLPAGTTIIPSLNSEHITTLTSTGELVTFVKERTPEPATTSPRTATPSPRTATPSPRASEGFTSEGFKSESPTRESRASNPNPNSSGPLSPGDPSQELLLPEKTRPTTPRGDRPASPQGSSPLGELNKSAPQPVQKPVLPPPVLPCLTPLPSLTTAIPSAALLYPILSAVSFNTPTGLYIALSSPVKLSVFVLARPDDENSDVRHYDLERTLDVKNATDLTCTGLTRWGDGTDYGDGPDYGDGSCR